MKYKFDFGSHLSKKNLFYVSSFGSPAQGSLALYVTLNFWFFHLFTFVTKRHRQYKHLILNTIVKCSSASLFIKIDKRLAPIASPPLSLRSANIPQLHNLKGTPCGPSLQLLLAHFQLRVELNHFLLYFYSLPADFLYFPSQSYFFLTSFEPSGLRRSSHRDKSATPSASTTRFIPPSAASSATTNDKNGSS
jgi:hypothetical protein|eukprot:c18208_g1_i1.p1 GENE.c18208_g1_i1~~c18208_g1_i1.p1  ORF type:complete len:192 (+),score=-33.18 c18208_g1_i1:1221-1796(+)